MNSHGSWRVDARVAAPAGVVVARADQLLVAVGGVELLAGRALAVPAGDLLVVELAVLGGVAVGAGAVGEARALGPDAAVDDADDDAFAGGAGLLPEAVAARQAEEVRRRRRVERARLVLADRQHAGRHRQLGGLRLGELGGEAVEGVAVAVRLEVARADAGEHRVVATRQVADVARDRRMVRVDLLALGGLGRGYPGDAALVGEHRVLDQLNDVQLAALSRRLRVGLFFAGRGRGLVRGNDALLLDDARRNRQRIGERGALRRQRRHLGRVD